ncbi:MAG TPA: nitroreductase family protein [Miltoncostaeaceae bacterium]|nr:nitroreductase family protein [Miltoncostaeaceae bacterium]
MEVAEAIRKRRAVRTYTDRPVDDEVLDGLLRLALRAPSGGGQQAWGLIVVREPGRRRAIADLIIAGGARYFGIMRPQRDASDEEHAEWARGYAEQVMGTYRIAPVWILGLLVPRGYPAEMEEGGYLDDLISLAFAFENLMLAARAEGLGTVPTTMFQRWEKDRLRELVGLPAEIDPAIVSPLGYPEAWPEGLAPALKRNFKTWRQLVNDETWGNTRE